MANHFLNRMFGSRRAPSPLLADGLADLQKLASARPSLQASAKVLAAILEAIFTESATEAALTLTPELAQEKLTSGVPLLRGAPLSIDDRSFRRRWLGVCAALQQPEADALAKQSFDSIALLHEVLAGRPEAVAIQAEALGLDAALLATVMRLTALPALAKFAEGLAPLRHGIAWPHGFCPACGSWPLLGESRGLEQLRFLRCGLCASAWEFGRFRCAFCGNQDHHQLGYFHVEGEEDRLRAGYCDGCRGYVKWMNALSALSAPQLLVADLASLHLDLVAADKGYLVPSA